MQLITSKMCTAIAVVVADAALNDTFHVESSNSRQGSNLLGLVEARENSWLG